MVKKSLKCNPWVQPQKWQNDLSSFPRQTIQHHSNPSLYLNHWCRRSWSWPVLWRSTHLLELTPKERCTFHHRGLECESRKSRDISGNRKVCPWSTKWSRAKSNRLLSREYAGHRKHLFQQPKRWLCTWTSFRWSTPKSGSLRSVQPKMKKLYVVSQNKTYS